MAGTLDSISIEKAIIIPSYRDFYCMLMLIHDMYNLPLAHIIIHTVNLSHKHKSGAD